MDNVGRFHFQNVSPFGHHLRHCAQTMLEKAEEERKFPDRIPYALRGRATLLYWGASVLLHARAVCIATALCISVIKTVFSQVNRDVLRIQKQMLHEAYSTYYLSVLAIFGKTVSLEGAGLPPLNLPQQPAMPAAPLPLPVQNQPLIHPPLAPQPPIAIIVAPLPQGQNPPEPVIAPVVPAVAIQPQPEPVIQEPPIEIVVQQVPAAEPAPVIAPVAQAVVAEQQQELVVQEPVVHAVLEPAPVIAPVAQAVVAEQQPEPVVQEPVVHAVLEPAPVIAPVAQAVVTEQQPEPAIQEPAVHAVLEPAPVIAPVAQAVVAEQQPELAIQEPAVHAVLEQPPVQELVPETAPAAQAVDVQQQNPIEKDDFVHVENNPQQADQAAPSAPDLAVQNQVEQPQEQAAPVAQAVVAEQQPKPVIQEPLAQTASEQPPAQGSTTPGVGLVEADPSNDDDFVHVEDNPQQADPAAPNVAGLAVQNQAKQPQEQAAPVIAPVAQAVVAEQQPEPIIQKPLAQAALDQPPAQGSTTPGVGLVEAAEDSEEEFVEISSFSNGREKEDSLDAPQQSEADSPRNSENTRGDAPIVHSYGNPTPTPPSSKAPSRSSSPTNEDPQNLEFTLNENFFGKRKEQDSDNIRDNAPSASQPPKLDFTSISTVLPSGIISPSQALLQPLSPLHTSILPAAASTPQPESPNLPLNSEQGENTTLEQPLFAPSSEPAKEFSLQNASKENTTPDSLNLPPITASNMALAQQLDPHSEHGENTTLEKPLSARSSEPAKEFSLQNAPKENTTPDSLNLPPITASNMALVQQLYPHSEQEENAISEQPLSARSSNQGEPLSHQGGTLLETLDLKKVTMTQSPNLSETDSGTPRSAKSPNSTASAPQEQPPAKITLPQQLSTVLSAGPASQIDENSAPPATVVDSLVAMKPAPIEEEDELSKGWVEEESEYKIPHSRDLSAKESIEQIQEIAAKQMRAEEPKGFVFNKGLLIQNDLTHFTLNAQIGEYEVGVCHVKTSQEMSLAAHIAVAKNLNIRSYTYPVHLFALIESGNEGLKKQIEQTLLSQIEKTLDDLAVTAIPEKSKSRGIFSFSSKNPEIPKELILEAIQKTIKGAIPEQDSQTNIAAALQLEGQLWIFNTGGSRILLNRGGVPERLSTDLAANPQTPIDHVFTVNVIKFSSSLPKGGHLVIGNEAFFKEASTAEVVQSLHQDNRGNNVRFSARDLAGSAHLHVKGRNEQASISCLVVNIRQENWRPW